MNNGNGDFARNADPQHVRTSEADPRVIKLAIVGDAVNIARRVIPKNSLEKVLRLLDRDEAQASQVIVKDVKRSHKHAAARARQPDQDTRDKSDDKQPCTQMPTDTDQPAAADVDELEGKKEDSSDAICQLPVLEPVAAESLPYISISFAELEYAHEFAIDYATVVDFGWVYSHRLLCSITMKVGSYLHIRA